MSNTHTSASPSVCMPGLGGIFLKTYTYLMTSNNNNILLFKLRKLFGKSEADDSLILTDQLRDLNNEQMILHMHCLNLLWNFSETPHDRRLVMDKGGLPLVIKALLFDPFEYLPRSDEYWKVVTINKRAVGCLLQ